MGGNLLNVYESVKAYKGESGPISPRTVTHRVWGQLSLEGSSLW